MRAGLQKGFTLIELLIVVVILGVLAAVIVPQLAGSTDDAKSAALNSNLANLRSAIASYYNDHGEYPGANLATGGTCGAGTAGTGAAGSAAAFASQLTMYTDADGVACSIKTGAYIYGPYLKSSGTGTAAIPKNAVSDSNTVTVVTAGDLTMTAAGGATGGWRMDTVTGQIIPDNS